MCWFWLVGTHKAPSSTRVFALRAISFAIPSRLSFKQPPDSPLPHQQLPPIHGRLLTNVRAFVLSSSLVDGPAGICCEIGQKNKLHESRTVVTATARPRQLVMFVVDKVIEEDRRMLLANEHESITLPDGTTQVTHLMFEEGNGERPQFLQLDYPTRRCALELIESVLTKYHQLFRKVRLPSFTYP